MATATPAPESELPSSLNHLRFEATRVFQGGAQQVVSAVRYPVPASSNDVQGQALAFAWKEWWKSTLFGRNPDTQDPRWASINRTGTIWKSFGEAANVATGQPHVYCYNCGSLMQHPTAKNTGVKHLWNHTKSQSCYYIETPVHPTQQPLTTLPKRPHNSKLPPYTPDALGKELVQLVVDNSWSFRSIERPSFRRFVQFLRPDAAIISRYKFGQAFENQFAAAYANILQDLEKDTKISIALDAWTGSNHLGFLAVKGYYITKKWELRERLLDFLPMRGQHTGLSMANEVLGVLRSTRTTDRLLGVTCDNASNNSTLSRSLESRLGEQGHTWSAAENTIPCLAHIINLVVQDIISHLKLASSDEDETKKSFQRSHCQGIETQISVPNSLRKVQLFLLQCFITG